MLLSEISEPSSENQEDFLGLSPCLSLVSRAEFDMIEDVLQACQDLAIVISSLLEARDSAPLTAREIIPLRAFTTTSRSSAGSRSRIGEAQMVPHRLYSEVIKECPLSSRTEL